MELFEIQYDWIKRTREILFRYCENFSMAEYVKKHESFGGDSIRGLHAHAADCYRVWLGNRALGKSLPPISVDSINNVQEMRELFRKTDDLVQEFLSEFKGRWDHVTEVEFQNGKRGAFTALWLFTHTVTHEFHHKGQIVKIGRSLGHVPPDTDLVEYEL